MPQKKVSIGDTLSSQTINDAACGRVQRAALQLLLTAAAVWPAEAAEMKVSSHYWEYRFAVFYPTLRIER